MKNEVARKLIEAAVVGGDIGPDSVVQFEVAWTLTDPSELRDMEKDIKGAIPREASLGSFEYRAEGDITPISTREAISVLRQGEEAVFGSVTVEDLVKNAPRTRQVLMRLGADVSNELVVVRNDYGKRVKVYISRSELQDLARS